MNVKALLGAFYQEKALVGAFSVFEKTDCETDGAVIKICIQMMFYIAVRG